MHIFISACQSEKPRVEPIARLLRKQGYQVFWWEDSIPAGQPLWKSIERNLEKAQCVVAFFSREALRSKAVRSEAEEGWQREILVPVLLEEISVPPPFAQLRYVEYFGEKHALGRAHKLILRAVRGLVGAPPKPTQRRSRKSLDALTRQAVITELDCEDVGGRLVDLAGDPVLQKRLVGRVLAQEVFAPDSEESLAPAGQALRAIDLRRMLRRRVQELRIRSALSCDCTFGVCATCYGRRAGGSLPKLGYQFGRETYGALNRHAKAAAIDSLLGVKRGAKRARLSELDGTARVTATSVIVTAAHGPRKRIAIPKGKRSVVATGDTVRAGDSLTSGEPAALDVMEILGLYVTRNLIVTQLRAALESLGEGASEPALEFLVRRMTQRVRIIDGGEVGFREGDVVPMSAVGHMNWMGYQLAHTNPELRGRDYWEGALYEPMVEDPRA